MSNFTGGEWKYLEWPMPFSDSTEQWYLLGSPERAVGFIRHEEDAKLIASAPEMYRLLNEAFLAMAEADIDEPLRLEIDECLCHITGEKCPTDEEAEYGEHL